ncbi:MAG: M48 family metalloprotease [Phycisphaerales bacterium]
MKARWMQLAIVGLGLAWALGGCVKNAATGKRQLNFLSREEEVAIGEQAKTEMTTEYGGAFADADVQAYVREVGMKLVAHTEGDYRTLPWEFTLLDSDVINAFALPGGKVFLSKGLAARLPDEAAMAAVLGHEVGHVTAEHADKRVSSAMITQGLVVGASAALGATADERTAAVGSMVLGGVGTGFLLKFGRDEESQADALGMRYMTRAGYSPHGMVSVMEVLTEASKGAERQWEILSTHPDPERRLKWAREAVRGGYSAEANDPNAIKGERAYQERMLRKTGKP